MLHTITGNMPFATSKKNTDMPKAGPSCEYILDAPGLPVHEFRISNPALRVIRSPICNVPVR